MKRFLLAGASLLSLAIACPPQTSAAAPYAPAASTRHTVNAAIASGARAGSSAIDVAAEAADFAGGAAGCELSQKKPAAKKPAPAVRKPSKKSAASRSGKESEREAAARSGSAGRSSTTKASAGRSTAGSRTSAKRGGRKAGTEKSSAAKATAGTSGALEQSDGRRRSATTKGTAGRGSSGKRTTKKGAPAAGTAKARTKQGDAGTSRERTTGAKKGKPATGAAKKGTSEKSRSASGQSGKSTTGRSTTGTSTTDRARRDPDASRDSGSRTAAKKSPVAPTLAWPVSGRRILEPYGERTNPTTRTVTLNPGINIAAKKGSDVRAAAAGTVSLVSWLPGYGTFVIVEHRDGYRTVYARLGSSSVEKGSSVRAGARIGQVAGSSLHFEVWRGQTRLDPAALLP